MKKLYIVRHAKSDWSNPSLSDFDRTLSKRGLHDAPMMGEKYKQLGFIPDMVISSSANRAISTCRIICEKLAFNPSQIDETKNLYLASSHTILQMVNGFSREWDSVMLFGHNPGLTEVIESLSNTNIGNLPTCALAEIHFEIDDWKLISWGMGKLKSFEYPKKYH